MHASGVVLVLFGLPFLANSAQLDRPTLRLGETRDPNVPTYFDLDEHIKDVHRELDRLSRLEGQTSSPPCQSSQIRRRQEVGDLSQSNWNRYAQAVRALKNSGNSRGLDAFEQFAQFHSQWAKEAHGSEKFLPWHRWFLYYYETALRKFNPRITVPYWNWARDARNPRASILFTKNRAGSARDGRPISDGSFAGWSSAFPFNHRIIRWLDPAIFLENEKTVRSLIRNRQSVCKFMDEVELIHGFPHIFVGGAVAPSDAGKQPGDMTLVSQSPNDPVFFNHQ